MLKDRNTEKLSIRKVMGAVCIAFGILIMLTKILYYIVTGDVIPLDGRGQLLVVTGAGLLGLTTLDGFVKGR